LQILENNTLKRLAAGAKANDEVRLVEHRRAHNICIELSGIRKPFAEIKVGAAAAAGWVLWWVGWWVLGSPVLGGLLGC
jgi:hypothetical protein